MLVYVCMYVSNEGPGSKLPAKLAKGGKERGKHNFECLVKISIILND